MDRRQAIKRVGLLMGGAVSMSTVAGVLGGCKAGPAGAPFTPQTLSAQQNNLVVTLTELIIPETDTPGAKAARVNEFIDVMLTEFYAPEDRDRFLRGLTAVDADAQDAHGKSFVALSPEEQHAMLAAMEQAAVTYAEQQAQRRRQLDEFGKEVLKPEPESDDAQREPANTPLERSDALEDVPADPPFFNMIKELTLFGYYTSEIGASQELKTMPFGAYDGAVAFADIGRAWS